MLMKYLLQEERESRCSKVGDGGAELLRPRNIACQDDTSEPEASTVVTLPGTSSKTL